ncbi:ABC transporter substrate-binding protein [Propionibacteriaceae bacterium Y2011]|uniref:ABC transporter substrate-binding protein n=1 Tax=Microlunatus sp. Y2014 TaxID=3418488 RepID=UPI003B4AC5F0
MRRRSLLGLALLAPAIASCTPGPSEASRDLVVGATAQPPALDPVVSDAAAIPQVLLYNLYETLLKLDDAGEMQPLLATDWTVSDDRLVYTFTLDDRANFPGGRKLTATDVVWSIERVRSEGTPVLQAQHAAVDAVEATDEQTVTVRLSRPSNSWLFSMTSTAGMVFDSEADGDWASQPAGSGPYTLTSWSKGADLVLGRRDDYWGDAPYAAQVTIRYFADPNALNAAMLSEQLDILSNVQAPQALAQFEDPARFTIIEGTTQGEVVMGFNNSGLLADKRLRQAINHAVDRQALLDTVWAGHGTLIGSMVPPTDPWYEDLSDTYPFDPARASALLTEAGYTKATPLRLRVPTIPYATASAQFVASQLREVGFEVTTDELEFPARWLDLVFTKADYDISIISHVEPRDIVKWADPEYYWRYDNPEVQRLVAEADVGTQEEQVEKFKQVARILAEDAVADFLFLLPNLVVTKPDIDGLPQNATTLAFDLTDLSRA